MACQNESQSIVGVKTSNSNVRAVASTVIESAQDGFKSEVQYLSVMATSHG